MSNEIVLHYDGPSFDGKMNLASLNDALKWFQDLVKTIDPKVNFEVLPFEQGSFKIKLSNIAEGTISWIVAGIVILVVQFYLHTEGEPYKIDLTNSMVSGDVNIVNINWEWHIFNQAILPIIRHEWTKKSLEKISKPLSYENDKLIYEEKEDWIKKEVEITYAQKAFFQKNDLEEKNNFTLRWWIYEMNFKKKTFRVQLWNGHSFNVSITTNLDFSKIAPYANTSSLELIWSIKMDRDGRILAMKLYDYNIVQTNLDVLE